MNIKEQAIIVATAIALLAYAVPATVWTVNNPKANEMTILTHFKDVITFKKLDKFQ